MIDLDAILYERGAIAHDVPLWTGPNTPKKMLTVATDEDWRESCERARFRISIGQGRLEDGWTWEEGIARWGAWYLRLGAGEVAMGRTTNEETWGQQKDRWLDIVFEVASKGSNHYEHQVVDGVMTSTPTGTVLTLRGRVHLDEVPREPRE